MKYKERIPDVLFKENGQYLGKPAEFNDKIIERRLRLVNQIPNFTGSDFTLLDIGCGNGASLFGLSAKMKYCLGLEITEEHLPEFNHFKKEYDLNNCECKIIDIEKNEPPNQFDRIISFEVIEHLENENGVKFYYNALKKDGLMAISVPNKWWIFETHGAKLPLLKWNRMPFFSWLPRQIHEKYANARIYTKERIIILLKKHGFTVISSEYITAPMDVLPEGRLKNFLIKYFFNSDTTIVPFKSTSLFIVAKKD
ncbi:MAG: class I SAM-dependent methyltransferase [Sphingobacteriia bacterium]|nr:MAG: class I SAM-dependent methyltransferase [Sphingobacteriia bacterium]